MSEAGARISGVALVGRIAGAYAAQRDPARAEAMRANLRGQFAFLGVDAPRRRAIDREVLDGVGRPSERELVAASRAAWRHEHREVQYFGVDWMRRHVEHRSPRLLGTAKGLITTKSWWDTVDPLAVHVVGPLVRQHPDLVGTMDEWIHDRNLWLARTAILHQLALGQDVDEARLFSYCLARADDPDFFIRKAIGWALRTYAKVAPSAVEQFVARHASTLSPLSRREALRHLRRADRGAPRRRGSR